MIAVVLLVALGSNPFIQECFEMGCSSVEPMCESIGCATPDPETIQTPTVPPPSSPTETSLTVILVSVLVPVTFIGVVTIAFAVNSHLSIIGNQEYWEIS